MDFGLDRTCGIGLLKLRGLWSITKPSSSWIISGFWSRLTMSGDLDISSTLQSAEKAKQFILKFYYPLFWTCIQSYVYIYLCTLAITCTYNVDVKNQWSGIDEQPIKQILLLTVSNKPSSTVNLWVLLLMRHLSEGGFSRITTPWITLIQILSYDDLAFL